MNEGASPHPYPPPGAEPTTWVTCEAIPAGAVISFSPAANRLEITHAKTVLVVAQPFILPDPR
jgi:hypothetical protein